MQTFKMNLHSLQGKLTRNEMRNIMAGANPKNSKVQKCCIGTECTSCQTNAGPCGPNATLTDC